MAAAAPSCSTSGAAWGTLGRNTIIYFAGIIMCRENDGDIKDYKIVFAETAVDYFVFSDVIFMFHIVFPFHLEEFSLFILNH